MSFNHGDALQGVWITDMAQTCFLVWVENLHLVLLYFLFGMDTRKKSSQDLHIHGGNCEISYELTLCSKATVYSGKVLQIAQFSELYF